MSTKKPRKSLNDALAHEFVYGESALREDSSIQATEDKETESAVLESPQEEHLSKKETLPEPEPESNPSKKVQSTKPSLMSQLQPESPKEATIRLTVDLPESMHQKLSMLAARTRRKKAEIVRFLLDEALKDVEE
ncbi:CopG family transcriptional regulator [Nostoc sp. UIC 10630]|uniref:CopG family transcriptional regulator n=1 Tax=Nostoc sp. UIC 10630 TaxID=2100146 RepID=UPI0013D285D6|nr:CopG family transcriptional regulator [Nostoc sp. UIC 10630]NEU77624.1 CopG family transcriptional regulator [Nostoc sp. UIC 10630]